jgi:uncharacterized membrane protein
LGDPAHREIPKLQRAGDLRHGALEESMKFSWQRESLPIGLIALMFGLAAWQWPTAPDIIPVHWNIHGQVDAWGGKFMGLLLLPLVALGVELLLRVLPGFEPKLKDDPRFQTPYYVVRVSVLLLLLAIYVFTLLSIHGRGIDAALLFPLLLGLFVAVLGAVIGKLPRNGIAGVRTRWTLSSEVSWQKSNLLGGRIFMGTGLSTMAAAFIAPFIALGLLLAGLIGGGICLLIYSHSVWKQDPDRAKL